MSTALAALWSSCKRARRGANREGAADDDAVGAEAGLAEGGLLRLELIHVLLELVGRGAALRLRLRGKTRSVAESAGRGAVGKNISAKGRH